MARGICFIVVLGITSLLNVPISFAGFLIELRNNRTICTGSYQAEGDRIVLYLESGAFKIGKDEVRSISKDKGCLDERKDFAGNLKEKMGGKSSVGSDREVMEHYKKAKTETQERLEESKKVYFSAPNKYEKDEARKRMLSISGELLKLQDEVAEENNGIIPDWWQEERSE